MMLPRREKGVGGAATGMPTSTLRSAPAGMDSINRPDASIIALMPVGSKYKLWIPASHGYGESGTPGGPIGPNQTLAFEVELIEIAAK